MPAALRSAISGYRQPSTAAHGLALRPPSQAARNGCELRSIHEKPAGNPPGRSTGFAPEFAEAALDGGYFTSIWRAVTCASTSLFLGMSMTMTPCSTFAEILSRSMLSGSNNRCWNRV